MENWKKETENLLRRYKHFDAEIKSLELQIEMTRLAGPSITPQYSERVSSGTYSTTSSTETFVMSVEMKEEKVKKIRIWQELIGIALEHALTPEEKIVYELRYRDEFLPDVVMSELKMDRRAYFKLQKQMLEKVALFIGLKEA